MSPDPAPSGVDAAAAANRDPAPAARRPSPPPSGISRRRLIAVDALIGLATLLALVGMIALWADRLLFNPVVTISTELLAQIASAFILIGAVLVAAAWFAGPARLATASRRALAPFLREHAAAALAITAAVMVLVFIWNPIPATGTPVGIIVFMALALLGTEALRRQTATEFPDARTGETTAALRARVRAIRERRHAGAPSPPSSESLTVQLERLAALRADGSITPAEYDTAKGSLLGK